MNLPEYIKNQISKIVNYRTFLQVGIIDDTNEDGTYRVKMQGKEYVYQSVAFRSDGKEVLKKGNPVLVGFIDGDKQKPIIVQPPNYSVSDTLNIYEV